MTQSTAISTNETTQLEQPQSEASNGLEPPTRKVKRCSQHGEYHANVFEIMGVEQGGRCPKCDAEAEAARNTDEAVRIKMDRDRKIRGNLSGAGIPLRFEGKDFKGYAAGCEHSKYALRVCQAYSERFIERLKAGGGLVMCGGPGTGKTHLACAIANYVIKQHGCTAVFMSVLKAVRSVKATYSRTADKTEAQAIQALAEPDLLVLDEVGVQFGSDAEKLILFEVINERYQSMKPTILISNLVIDELKEYIGERVVDRMQEGGGAVLPFDWGSYRGQL